MNILEAMKKNVLVYDGSKGVVLQSMGLTSGEIGENWNVDHPEKVLEVYRTYREAGSDVLQTNTFSGNRISLSAHGAAERLYELNFAGVKLAKDVADGAYVSASVGPTGQMMAPFGSLTFEKAYEVFAEQAKVIEEAGADAIHFETFMDISELRAAILAAKENTSLPIIVSVALEENGATLMGCSPAICARVCEAAGADVVGVNCSCGPEMLLKPVAEMAANCSLPIVAKPNAGLPVTENGVSVYKQTPEEFAALAPEFLKLGVRLIGGCCGTTPVFMTEVKKAIDGAETDRSEKTEGSFICSYSQLLSLDEDYETEEVEVSDPDDVVDDAQDAADEADVIVLNFTEEADYDMCDMVANLCSMVRTPVILKGDKDSIEKFVRCYPGVPGVLGDISGLEKYGAVRV